MVMALAFLSVGPGEILLVLFLVVVLFGVDTAPKIAREIGRMQARLSRTTQQILQTIELEQLGISPEQHAQEQARELQMRANAPASPPAAPSQDAPPRDASEPAPPEDGFRKSSDSPAGDKRAP
ncbi:MAG: hypothetical protein ACYDDF_01070 [Thermoplasmatota archaeon]